MKYYKLKELIDNLPLAKTYLEFWNMLHKIDEITKSLSFNDVKSLSVEKIRTYNDKK